MRSTFWHQSHLSSLNGSRDIEGSNPLPFILCLNVYSSSLASPCVTTWPSQLMLEPPLAFPLVLWQSLARISLWKKPWLGQGSNRWSLDPIEWKPRTLTQRHGWTDEDRRSILGHMLEDIRLQYWVQFYCPIGSQESCSSAGTCSIANGWQAFYCLAAPTFGRSLVRESVGVSVSCGTNLESINTNYILCEYGVFTLTLHQRI